MRRIAAICATLLLLAGCVPSVRLNERGVVQAIGIDLAEEGGYRATMQVREAVGTTAGANQSPEDARTVLVEETGATITELLARASATQGRQLFLDSVRVIVLGQEAARAGVEGPLGFFNSNHQISPATLVAVAEGEAGELIRAGEKDPALSAEGLADVLESAGKGGFSPPSRLKDLMGAANAENIAGAVTLLRYGAPDEAPANEASSEASQDESGAGSEARQEEETPEKKLSLGGAAVFVGDRMSAAISPAAARGLEWTQNRAKACVLSVGDGQLGEVAAVTHRQKAKITVEMSGEVPVFDIRLEVRSTALESRLVSGGFDDRTRRYVCALQEIEIRSEIEEMVASSLRRGYDLLGLSRLMRQRYPAFYEAHRENWGEALASCGYNVAVSCEIDRTGSGNR
ncbi:Ger(x)C family spore germination protein [uncultured Anaerotruncus sp.]|uniref:Ger(x)C family spore germination protein n=1 Tax=uncultured Anaerotruncus sp. TaxID=905011 RepID=UPI00280AA5BF|nr:Ger(x)C family spore germination protein [uncultured Anaerotruncus sp.]